MLKYIPPWFSITNVDSKTCLTHVCFVSVFLGLNLFFSLHATTSNPKHCLRTPSKQLLPPSTTTIFSLLASSPVSTATHGLCRPGFQAMLHQCMAFAGQAFKPCSIGQSQASLNGKCSHKLFFFGNHLRCAQNIFHQSIHHLWGITFLPLHICQHFFLSIHPVLDV